MKQQLTLGSLFDGIGGWQLAAVRAGIVPIWSSEIEAFPIDVTRRHFPDTLQLGDVTKIDGGNIPPVDIICAGSPCQDLSVAGKRTGLAGERSGLFVRAVDIVRQMRRATDGEKPRFFVWENVPGAFSSNHRQDFRAVLTEIGEAEILMPRSGRWADAGLVRTAACDIAWRVLDAQYWGVPQRRKRIFLVADFAADGRCAGEILFECEGVQGHPAACGGAREDAAGGAESGARTASAGFLMKNSAAAGGIGYTPEQSPTLNTMDRHAVAPCAEEVYEHHPMDSRVKGPIDVMTTVSTRMGAGQNNTPLVRQVVGSLCARDYKGIGNQDLDKLQMQSHTVRRLTPLECERLQGLPDGYTDVEFKGKPAPDTRRYKAIGNGMAQPCADFVLRRIAKETGHED